MSVGLLRRVFVVVTDQEGTPVAQRYLDEDRIVDWLLRNGGGSAHRCDVYDDAPACGGVVLDTLHRHGPTSWTTSPIGQPPTE